MMKASALEYRFRYVLHAVLYALGFLAPWERVSALSLGQTTTWLTLAAIPAREHWMSFTDASRCMLLVACAFAVAGAVLRVWAASYLGASVMQSPGMQGTRVVADGPYRHLRHPLYLGTFLNVLALSILMPPTGSVFAIVTVALFQLRLAAAEELFLLTTLGPAYQAYGAAVPRWWPRLRARVPGAGDRHHLLLGIASELFVVGCAVSLLTLGWRYNSLLVIKGVLIALGLSLIARAFIPAPSAAAKARAVHL